MVKAERRRTILDLEYLFETKITSSGLLETLESINRHNIIMHTPTCKKNGKTRGQTVVNNRHYGAAAWSDGGHNYWNEGHIVNTPSNMANVHTLFRHHRTHSNTMSA